MRGAYVSLVTDGKLVTTACAAAAEDGTSIDALHTLAKSVRLRALAIVGLKSTFRHVRLRRLSALMSMGARPVKIRFESFSVYPNRAARIVGPGRATCSVPVRKSGGVQIERSTVDWCASM